MEKKFILIDEDIRRNVSAPMCCMDTYGFDNERKVDLCDAIARVLPEHNEAEIRASVDALTDKPNDAIGYQNRVRIGFHNFALVAVAEI